MGNREVLEKNRKDRIGEVSYNKYGSKMTIVEYKNSNDMTIEFDDGHIRKTDYTSFKDGGVGNPYDKSVCGVGYLGEGEFKTSIGHKHTREYHDWLHMIQRCYNDKNLLARPTYKDCSVCEEWHNFQKFASWHKENYYEVEGELMSLDKDILIKGNRMYSPETCVFVPKRINNLFETKLDNNTSGTRGIYLDKRYNTYSANCGVGNGKRSKHIGSFKTLDEAFLAYKEFKENFIKQVADEYKDRIPQRLYEALYNYKVEINDK
jgi:hypothetical protein